MKEPQHIDFGVLKKNSSGVYPIPFTELGGLRFIEIPFYSTVEIEELPGTYETYDLNMTATHGGGPSDEFFTLNVHVAFHVTGDADNDTAIKTCMRKSKHIKRFFAETTNLLAFEDGPDWVPFFQGNAALFVDILFSRTFTRLENPVLTDFIRPFVARFSEFLKSKDPLLFICHASEDKPVVDALCRFLDGQNVSVWYDRREIQVGDSIVQRVEQGLRAASHVVVVLSSVSVQRPWVQRELSSTLMRQLQDASVQILPMVIEQCTLPSLLSDIRFADCRTNWDHGFHEILEVVL